MVYYRDTNGQWTPEKNELVYLDFICICSSPNRSPSQNVLRHTFTTTKICGRSYGTMERFEMVCSAGTFGYV
ncbi:hypothetical protein BJ875DRAFT_33137 [Amylocarpus encephaloides]|uniref:Uncharacterized protein n=1 Tax=Amylocarpus encephaloides TaxID=45428 RepID=A0A9P7YRF4_9HELO|nr:hypothetical protein BJ875DRAFT_33137 [Amylocarpus encephaloides]